VKTKREKKLTYKEMVGILSGFRKELLIMRNEISSVHFLINSFLEMNDDVDSLTNFIEGKIEKEKDDTATDGEKEQTEGSRVTKTSSKSG
jgi:hypothetical protein|tara:strand:- start:162 stop:431 length:270 start_codon:yes stop_codon:yes gene_type:complete